METFKAHGDSQMHRDARGKLWNITKTDIVTQLGQQVNREQIVAQKALVRIITSLRYLLTEGMPLRGKCDNEGKFKNLLKLRAEDDENFATWLCRTTNYTSKDIVNEMARVMSHEILYSITNEIRSDSIQFVIIVDGTQDTSGKEQESICIRYVTHNFEVKEEFIGLYESSETTGVALASMVKDALLRLNLDINNLRAQTYDGAANMAGEYNGCQAKIKTVQPLACYTHCGAHVSHLIVSNYICEALFVRDALDCVHVAAQATGLLTSFMNPKTMLGLRTSLPILRCLGSFNRTLQGKDQSVSGMLLGAELIKKELLNLRDEEKFAQIVSMVDTDITDLDLNEFALPRKRKVPMRLGGGDVNPMASASSVSGVYRPDYFKIIDAAVQNLDKYFTSTDLERYGELCSVLITGSDPTNITKKYPEVSDNLKEELFFIGSFPLEISNPLAKYSLKWFPMYEKCSPM